MFRTAIVILLAPLTKRHLRRNSDFSLSALFGASAQLKEWVSVSKAIGDTELSPVGRKDEQGLSGIRSALACSGGIW